jgi:hypothetical protein
MRRSKLATGAFWHFAQQIATRSVDPQNVEIKYFGGSGRAFFCRI